MKSSITVNNLENLIPVLSTKEKQEIIAYYTVYEKYAEEFSKKATEDLKDHPVFGKLIRDIPKEVAAANDKLSRELQKDAIINDNWQPYIEYQIEQGIAYAKMGLDFKSWYEVIALVRNYLTPYLQKEYESGAESLSAINGMNNFMDIAMGIIGEAYMQEKNEIIKADREVIKKQNEELEQKVIERTAQLLAVNKELESFSYSISHDLRAPLRAINGFAKVLHEDFASKLDVEGMSSLNAIMNNSKRMGILIDDLLAFSRLGRNEISTSEINMTALVNSVKESVKEEELAGNTNEIEFLIHALPPAKGDQALIKQVWVNLISNAIKFSKNKPKINIEIGSYYKDHEIVYFVKDNGVGFDMRYYNKLFGVFQRLHSQEEFEGTGVGLAIVQKIIQRHNGTIWAESKPNEETSFYFSLPNINS